AFPRFGGAQIDFRGTTRIDPDWSARAPERLWRQDVGAGWSGFAIVNGVAVTQEERGEEQAVTAYDLATGELLWVHTWPGTFWNAMGGAGPRATPTIAHGNVYALGPRGRLVCLNGADGELRWSYDVLASHGMGEAEEEARVAYGRANSPLVDGELLVVPAGGVPGAGQAGLVALDAHSGQREWASAPRQVSFASPSRVTLLGRPMLMIVNEGSVSAHHPETGALLWEHPWPSNTPADASSSQARALSGDRVFLSKGYKDGGSSILQLSDEDGEIRVSELWHVTRALKTKFTNVVFYGETAVGLSDGMLECIDLADGARLWKNGRYGHGQVLGVGAHLLVLSEEGELLLIDPTPQAGGEVLARQQVLEGRTWNNLALSGDLLAVRNAREAAVWRLPLAGE
ncbi:MAG: PQQ-binding-like beta-propeller repeat protein, partial [Planctomycetota bacterium]|nr:PQQ-binding-like beta-propeller repeat protein [Planctomycetota bacterium]